MRPPRWKPLIEKSIAACCAAIEIYKKPVVSHREETFAILLVSAWELLLKARLLREAGSRLQSIYETTPVKRKDGSNGKRVKTKLNRAGNPMTIGLGTAMHRASVLPRYPLDAACQENLVLLTEIRDSAIHFVNDDRDLATRVHEIGTASLMNYVAVLGDWFEYDIGPHRFAILPLSFDTADVRAVQVRGRSRQIANLLAHMDRIVAEQPNSPDDRFRVAVHVVTHIAGSREPDAVPVKLGKGDGAVKVELTEDVLRQRWPHDYKQLTSMVKQRVPGLKINKAFNDAVRLLSGEERFARVRWLDINTPKSGKKTYYSPAMVDAIVSSMKASNTPGQNV